MPPNGFVLCVWIFFNSLLINFSAFVFNSVSRVVCGSWTLKIWKSNISSEWPLFFVDVQTKLKPNYNSSICRATKITYIQDYWNIRRHTSRKNGSLWYRNCPLELFTQPEIGIGIDSLFFLSIRYTWKLWLTWAPCELFMNIWNEYITWPMGAHVERKFHYMVTRSQSIGFTRSGRPCAILGVVILKSELLLAASWKREEFRGHTKWTTKLLLKYYICYCWCSTVSGECVRK